MNVVFFNVTGAGHVNPTLPIVRALADEGARITYFTAPARREAVESAGAAHRSYGRDDFTVAHYHPKGIFPLQLLPATAAIVPYLLEQTRPLAPDVIVTDTMAPWGLVVARALGVPVVASSSSFALPASLLRGMLEQLGCAVDDENRAAIAHIRQEWGVTFDEHDLGMHYADTNLVYTTRAFNPPLEDRAGRFEFIGALIRPLESSRPPFEELADSSKKRIYVSMGTIVGELFELGRSFYEPFFDAFGGRGDVRVVLSVGKATDPAALGAPQNFVVRRSVPQIDVLNHVDVFVTHCGMNSANEALHHGVPMVAMPVFGDQPLVAQRLVELGVARRVDFVRADANEPGPGPMGLRPRPVDPRTLAESVDELVTSSAVSSAAAALAESFRAAPGVSRAIEVVHELRNGTRRTDASVL